MTSISADIIQIVISDLMFWRHLHQLIKMCKPLVDAIRNLESQDINLADCMLEFIHCAHTMMQVTFADDEVVNFWAHVKSVFNCEFHLMNTSNHNLALFFHPTCQKLAVSNAAKGRTFQEISRAALNIAHQWRWSERKARLLVHDLSQYYECKGPFAGDKTDGKAWWEGLDITQEEHPIKTLAITLLSIVPHAAEVERLFSDLTGIQGVKKCNLNIETFETLGKLRANYNYHIQQRTIEARKPIPRRKHAHMHTRAEPGIDVALATDISTNFMWMPPLVGTTDDDDIMQGPEGLTGDEIDAAFDELEREATLAGGNLVADINASNIGVDRTYNLAALDLIERGVGPTVAVDDVQMHEVASTAAGWNASTLLGI